MCEEFPVRDRSAIAGKLGGTPLHANSDPTGLRSGERHDVVSYCSEVAFKGSLQFGELKSGAIVASVPAATLEPEVQMSDWSQFRSRPHLLIPHIMTTGVDHANRCQKGVNVVQGGVIDCGNCPVTIGVLVCNPIEFLIVAGLQHMISEIRHGTQSMDKPEKHGRVGSNSAPSPDGTGRQNRRGYRGICP